MKARLLTGIAALAFCATACQDDETVFNKGNIVGGTYKAVMEQTIDSRSVVTDEGKFSWASDDKITVISADGNTKEDIMLSVSEGKGTFTLSIVPNPKYVTYPQIAKDYTDGNLRKITLPETYGTAEAVYVASTNAAMVADMTDIADNTADYTTDEVLFRHLAGVLRIKFSRVPVGCDRFVLSANENITGDFTVNMNEENPEIKLGEGEGSGKTVTFNFKEIGTMQPMTFYIPLPVGKYTGFSVKLMDGETELFSKSTTTTSDREIKRGTLALLSEVTDDIAAAGLTDGLYYSIDEGAYTKWPETIGNTFASAQTLRIITVGTDTYLTPTELDNLMEKNPPALEILDMKEAQYKDADGNENGVVAFPSYVDSDKIPIQPQNSELMQIKKMILPNNVTKIFRYSDGAPGGSLAAIKNQNPFIGHTKLETVEFGEKLVELDCAVLKIGSQTDINTAMPGIKQIEKIGLHVFDNTLYTGDINLESCKEIGDYALYRSNFSSVTLNSKTNVTIGKSAFNGAKQLVTIENWDKVISVGESAFEGAILFKGNNEGEIDLSNITEIGKKAFSQTVVEKVKIGSKLTNIPSSAFYKCFQLQEVDFTGCNNTLTIQACAFASTNQQHHLTSVTIPAGVKMHPTAFIGINTLHTLNLDGTTDLDGNVFSQDNGILFNSDKTILYMYPACIKEGTTDTEYTIPNSVTTIGWGAFYSNQTLKKVIIPSNVTALGTLDGGNAVSTFWGSKIEEVDMKEAQISTLGGECFKAAESLKKVSLPTILTSIGDQAFKYTGSLDEITCNNSTTAPTLSGDPFNKSNSNAGGSITGANALNKNVIYPKDSESIYVNSASDTFYSVLNGLGYTFKKTSE